MAAGWRENRSKELWLCPGWLLSLAGSWTVVPWVAVGRRLVPSGLHHGVAALAKAAGFEDSPRQSGSAMKH